MRKRASDLSTRAFWLEAKRAERQEATDLVNTNLKVLSKSLAMMALDNDSALLDT